MPYVNAWVSGDERLMTALPCARSIASGDLDLQSLDHLKRITFEQPCQQKRRHVERGSCAEFVSHRCTSMLFADAPRAFVGIEAATRGIAKVNPAVGNA